MFRSSGNFPTVCTVEVNTSFLPIQMNTSNGARYYEAAFDVVLLFGLTELKAQIAYYHNVCDHPRVFL
jgi:hypothetical protein